jgi:CRISPR-associated protein Cst2
MKNLKTQGFVLLDVDVVALNNAGTKKTNNYDNVTETKKIYKNGRTFVYVSGQAWRYWWRESLQKNLNWEMSPIIKLENKNQAFTSCNPIKYADDDVFGYMKAAKDDVVDDAGNIVKDKKGKDKKTDVTVTRVSPLKNSAIISVSSTRPVENFSSMSRHDGVPVPYGKQEYSAIMKGMFSLDLAMVGTFSNYNKTGFVNLSDNLKKDALEKGAVEIDDNYMKDDKGKALKLIRLDREIRLKRAKDTILALKNISGGAMQTSNMGDVTPKFIILATTKTGNHPFSHVATNYGDENDNVLLNIEALKEIIKDYQSDFEGKIYIGKRAGFFDDKNEELKNLETEFKDLIELKSVNEAIESYCKQIENQIE